jgi:hypothetical protein
VPRNAFAGPEHPEDANPLGEQQLYPVDLPRTPNFDETGQPIPGSLRGTGLGSDIHVIYAMEDWAGLPDTDPSEVLLHELVHGLRQERGQLHNERFRPFGRLVQNYDTIEEFYAIVIANIYRSENGQRVLRADHGSGALSWPLTSDGVFALVYATQLDRLIDQMFLLCLHLGAIACDFNPIRRRLLARGFTPARLAELAGIADVVRL